MTAQRFVLGVCGGLVLLLAASSGDAHHSVAAGFDMSKTITVVGTITKMEWRNPHARLTVEVKNDQGQVEPWDVWFGSANSLYRRGWRQDDLPAGAVVTVTGFRARDGSRALYGGGQTKLPDGRTLFGGDAPKDETKDKTP
jgi:hypothetical protein